MSAILQFMRDHHILSVIEHTALKRKSRLNLNEYEICVIPQLLYNCVDLEELYLHRNKITTVPVEITQIHNLTSMTLDYNNLSTLPPEIGNLKNLVNLNISYNPLGVLIPEIGGLENLEAFWCNKIGIKELPKEIGMLSKLDTFGARGNELKTIPEEMTRLSKLRWLTLENNEIETLPSTMDGMVALVHCNLRNNRIREFPDSLRRCPDLMFLQMNNNEILHLPEGFDTNILTSLEMIDLRLNPICDTSFPLIPLVKFTDEPPPPAQQSESWVVLGLNPAGAGAGPTQPRVHGELELDTSSIESSEDWENSVDSIDLDAQYQSDEERGDNEKCQSVVRLIEYHSPMTLPLLNVKVTSDLWNSFLQICKC